MASSKKPRKKYNPRTLDKNKPPTPQKLRKAFKPIEDLYQQIISDSVYVMGSNVVLMDWEGEPIEIRVAMEGWCICMERLAEDCKTPLKLLAIRKMGVWLSLGTPIPESLTQEFRRELDACTAFYASVPVYQINRSMLTENIAVELGTYNG